MHLMRDEHKLPNSVICRYNQFVGVRPPQILEEALGIAHLKKYIRQYPKNVANTSAQTVRASTMIRRLRTLWE